MSMLEVIMTLLMFLIVTILIMSAIIMICIYIAIRKGEDIESDEVRDKYTEFASISSIVIVLIVFVLCK